MDFVQNFPMLSIILSFISVVICSLVPRKVGRYYTMIVNVIVCAMGVTMIIYTAQHGSFNYSMGHFPAPYDNEIRIGILEAILASLFPIIIMLSILGGMDSLEKDVNEKKERFIYVLLNLVQVAIIAMIYTNDVFTAYVFLEISTLASIGLVMIKDKGHTIAAAMRYMIFNLVGSGLFLIGNVLLYATTGYLSMEYIKVALEALQAAGGHQPIITLTFALITLGLGIKSGLFPFYFWMPDTYGEATTTSSCVVSGIISKGYIILLFKYMYRTFGLDLIVSTHMPTILFVLGVLGMIFGSFSAISQKKLNKMVAFSSAAQIGYIYMGLGMGGYGLVAAIFQVICHAIMKPLLFVSSASLIKTAHGKEDFVSLRGVGRKNVVAGVTFTIGALSMVGFPVFAGFVMKFLFVEASVAPTLPKWQMILAVVALVVSTLLNTLYYIRTVMTIFRPKANNERSTRAWPPFSATLSMAGFALLNFAIGTSTAFVDVLEQGLHLLG